MVDPSHAPDERESRPAPQRRSAGRAWRVGRLPMPLRIPLAGMLAVAAAATVIWIPWLGMSPCLLLPVSAVWVASALASVWLAFAARPDDLWRTVDVFCAGLATGALVVGWLILHGHTPWR
jgi:hypothetical protein